MKLFILLSLIFSVSAKLNTHTRIVGGVNAKIEEIPSIVAIISIKYQTQWCAGTTISENWILTAAHCYFEPHEIIIQYGTNDIINITDTSKIAHAVKFIKHEYYSEYELNYDIGLIQTKEALLTGMYGSFAKLAVPGSYYPTGTSGLVAGWGYWDMLNITKPPLLKAELKIMNYKICQYAFRNNTLGMQVFKHQICAGVPDFSKAECSGDSGGPLFVDGVQVGIVSWSIKPCGSSGYPGVYTDVRLFISWIEEHTGIDFQLGNYLARKTPFLL